MEKGRAEAPAYSSERESGEYLRVNSCGEQWLFDRDYDTLRKGGRVDYAIQYISQGMGYYEEGGQLYPVEPGSLILYFPGVRQHYAFRRENKTLLLWTHFTGTACAMLEPLKKPGAVVARPAHTQEFEQVFRRMLHAHFLKEPYNDRIAQGCLLLLLSLLMKGTCSPLGGGTGRDHEGLDQVMNHMQRHFHEPVDLGRYAAMCFVSRGRFLHIFKERFGISPYQCQLRIRLDRAAEMLSNTPISVSACAEAVGFKDCSYFCRIFKKYTGRTPMALKKAIGK